MKLTIGFSNSAVPVPRGAASHFVARQRSRSFDATRDALLSAAALCLATLVAAPPASAQFVCTTTPADINCKNSGTAAAGFTSTAAGANQNDTVSNSGTASGFSANTFGGGNATASNTGTNNGEVNASTGGGGNATASNSGHTDGVVIAQTFGGGDALAVNTGTSNNGIKAQTFNVSGNARAVNSGSNLGSILVLTFTGKASVDNSGTNAGDINVATANGGSATVVNSGSTGNISASTNTADNASVTNSGIAHDIIVQSALAQAVLTNVVGGRVTGFISLTGARNVVNFAGGNWLLTVVTAGGGTTINTGGAPFVLGPTGQSGTPIAVLDATAFALADRTLVNVTGEISQVLRGRFGGMTAGPGGGALGFAATDSGVAGQAEAAFSGIPLAAMSYASNPKPIIGKAPAAAPYYDTTVWASGFGGERHQRANADVLRSDDTAFGGALGVDRRVSSNLWLGAFVGGVAGREMVEHVQTIDATYVFGGAYGRFDWISQYLDFALYGGGIGNKSTRQIANNAVASGLESATASYGGWFINPEVTYGYRIAVNAITVAPRLRLRYVGGQLSGFNESGSTQNLTVGRRSINDLEERGEVELSTVSGGLKATATIGMIGLERLGNPTINTVLLAQNLSFATPGQKNAVGGVVGLGVQYRALPNVTLFLAGEGTAMSDKSDSFAASGGARVAF